jgi:hypothetical protein
MRLPAAKEAVEAEHMINAALVRIVKVTRLE